MRFQFHQTGLIAAMAALIFSAPTAAEDNDELFQRIKAHMSEHLAQLPNFVCHETIDRLIRMEMQAHPREVGSPINILELTADGARWLQDGGNCRLPGVGW